MTVAAGAASTGARREMSLKALDRLAAAATFVIFCAAIFILAGEFESVNLSDLLAAFTAMPRRQIVAGLGLTIASYLLLTGYDFLALRYVGRRLPVRDTLFASFTAFAFSNGIGFQLLSGGSMRYRIYSSFGIPAVEIGEIVAFCTVSYALGAITVAGLVALFEPAEFGLLLHLSEPLAFALGLALVGGSAAFLMAVALRHEPIELGRFRLRMPPLRLAVGQIVLASADAVLAGTVIYALLPFDFGITFKAFLGVYMLAATASVLSLVPGGLGVFETVTTLLTAPPSKAAMLGAFLAYRLIYFIAPLLLAIALLVLHELGRKAQKSSE
jgi:uncharacterized membrane protein YbhN (UPF0104 family)